jgi:hypothetical protein
MKMFEVAEGTQGVVFTHADKSVKPYKVTQTLLFSDHELVSDPVRFYNNKGVVDAFNLPVTEGYIDQVKALVKAGNSVFWRANRHGVTIFLAVQHSKVKVL